MSADLIVLKVDAARSPDPRREWAVSGPTGLCLPAMLPGCGPALAAVHVLVARHGLSYDAAKAGMRKAESCEPSWDRPDHYVYVWEAPAA